MDIDRDLTWKVHIERMYRQCMGKMAVIRRAGSDLPCHIRKLLAIPGICTPSFGLLLSGLWNHLD